MTPAVRIIAHAFAEHQIRREAKAYALTVPQSDRNARHARIWPMSGQSRNGSVRFCRRISGLRHSDAARRVGLGGGNQVFSDIPPFWMLSAANAQTPDFPEQAHHAVPAFSPYAYQEGVSLVPAFTYVTLDSWSRSRRVIGKAGVTGVDANPRFIVTSLRPA